MLKLSILQMRRHLQDGVDLMICHNGLSASQLSSLKIGGVILFRQREEMFQLEPPESTDWRGSDFVEKLKDQPQRNYWKIYPPRLRIQAPELILDNDVLFSRRGIDIVREFFSGDELLLTAPMYRSYGRLDHLIPRRFAINVGVVGLPAGFDFEKHLRERIDLIGAWKNYYDDQGLIAMALCDHKSRIISRRLINYGGEGQRPIHHLVGINYLDHHPGWKNFLYRSLWMD